MVSIISIIGMIFTVLLCVGCVVIPLILIWNKTKTVSTGIFSAFGLGVTAYLWSQILVRLSIVNIMSMLQPFKNIINNTYYIWVIIEALLATVFLILGAVWAVYLTNRRKPSIYRGISVALGYFATESVIFLLISYFNYIKYAFQINGGTFQTAMQAKGYSEAQINELSNALVSANPLIFFVSSLDRVLMLMITVFIILIVTKAMMDKNYLKGIGLATGLDFIINTISSFIKALPDEKMGNILGQTASDVICYVFYIITVGIIIYYLYRKGYLKGKSERR